jgi:hypothetical protein
MFVRGPRYGVAGADGHHFQIALRMERILLPFIRQGLPRSSLRQALALPKEKAMIW